MADKFVEQRFNSSINPLADLGKPEERFLIQVANNPKFQAEEAREELEDRDSFSDVQVSTLDGRRDSRAKVGPTGLTSKTYPHLKFGQEAMQVVGAQPEFIAANQLQAQALNCAVILRAGDPPQYNKRRSPKSGVNLSKSSKQGFFKGALAKETRFGRFGEKAYKQKDLDNLVKPATDVDYQHTMQLDINVRDIIREVSSEGDLEVLGFDQGTGLLRLAYKPGCGPSEEQFTGQFVIDLSSGDNSPMFYSRAWDKPENDPDWDPDNKVIRKPEGLSDIPDNLYKHVFNHSFKVSYSEEKLEKPSRSDLKKAEVFANRPRNAAGFKEAMALEQKDSQILAMIQQTHTVDEITALIEQLRMSPTLQAVLNTLKECLGQEEAEEVIKATYDLSGSIVAGDWDGLALGHPPDIKDAYKVVYNTFAPGVGGLENIEGLYRASSAYLQELKDKALKKDAAGEALNAFDEKVLTINNLSEIVSDFAKERAGCITPHEFLFQQVLNAAYRDPMARHYGEHYNNALLQDTMDQLLELQHDISEEEQTRLVQNLLLANFQQEDQHLPSVLKEVFIEHLDKHLTIAKRNNQTSYSLPNIAFDHNVQDLYQHGFDMRNPYGCDLGEQWLMALPDGGIIYGDRQQDLVEVMLTGNFLAQNHIDLNPKVDLNIGWDKVIERQLQLNQPVQDETLENYSKYKEAKGESILCVPESNGESIADRIRLAYQLERESLSSTASDNRSQSSGGG